MKWNNELKVGLFALGAALIIGYMFFVLSPEMLQRGHSVNYYTIVDDAAGIVNKTQVKTSGIVIGKVEGVYLDANQSRIDFSIEKETKIPIGSEIVIKEKGLLGDVFLEVVRAPDNGEYF